LIEKGVFAFLLSIHLRSYRFLDIFSTILAIIDEEWENAEKTGPTPPPISTCPFSVHLSFQTSEYYYMEEQ
jgi:hypothetical protein